jgi:hypothetical protein
MPRPRLLLWLAAGTLAVGAMAVSCTYSPNFRNGSLQCSPDLQCPRGYVCSTKQTCCLPDDATCGGTITIDAGVGGNPGTHFDARVDLPGFGSGGTTTAGTGGQGGQSGTGTGGSGTVRVQDYVGVWTFASSATVTTECESTRSPSGVGSFNTGTTLTITDNGDGTLNASWTEWPACTYTLTVDATGAHGSDADTWFCEYTAKDPALFWSYYTFDVVAASATVATHDATYVREDDYADGTTVYCSQTVHAPMTKN